jgi:hypothetical protein
MMNVEEILEMWSKDSEIHENHLDKSSVETAKMHSKYLELYTVSKLQLKRLRLKISSLKKDKWLYYTGKMTKEDMDDRGWDYDPYKGGIKPLKGDMDYYYDADPDIQELVAKIEYQETVVETLEEIMTNIRWRHSTIKNIIDWHKFTSGG